MSGGDPIQRLATPADLARTKLQHGRMYELDFLRTDGALVAAAKRCCDAQKRASAEQLRCFVPSPAAADNVSPAALQALLASGVAPSDSVTDPQITDYIMFHTAKTHALYREDIVALRAGLDELVRLRLRELFPHRTTLAPVISGQFLYPPGSHLGWHTNARVPGWRLYIVHAEEPRRSFFRYRDIRSGSIVTAWDEEWNARLINFDDREPFWHAVYSDTIRFSFGYRLDGPYRRSVRARLARAARRLGLSRSR